MLPTLNTLAPAIAMLAVGLLAWFGVRDIYRGADRRRGVLMLVAALVLLGNVLIWMW